MASARVVGEGVRVGFRASGGDFSAGGPVVRAGQWVPVAVTLALENQNTFDGALRIKQRDPDGDFCCDEVPVHLRADSGPQKTFYLYTVAGLSPDPSDYAVTVVDDKGEAIEVVSGGELVRRLEPSSPPSVLPDQRYLILSLTSEVSAIGKISALTGLERTDRYWRPIHVGHITPPDVPTHWLGLEMVDCIVWDDADATVLNRAQRTALIDWVRHGGKLLIAAARTADTLAQSDVIGPLLPVELGKVVTTRRLPELERRLLGPHEGTDPGSAGPIPVVFCTLRAEPGVYEVLSESPRSDGGDAGAAAGSVLVSRRRLDGGQVVFVGASLRDLLRDDVGAVSFLQKVLGLRDSVGGDAISSRELFPALQDQVGFLGTGGAYLVLAFLFGVAYLAVATFGAWGLLRSRGWLRHSWVAFGATGAVASALSVIGVQTARGVGQTLHQLTIVDVTAGQYSARATTYFGLKTGTHSVLDVWMPSDYPQETEPGPTRGFLKPMAELRADGLPQAGGFADPAEYRVVPASAELTDVPIRATLKRFEGRWQGTLPGQVRASVRILRGVALTEEALIEEQSKVYYEDVVTPDSTLTNQLGVDLEACYLFHAGKDAFEGSNFTCFSPRAGTEVTGSYIYAHPIRGGLRDGETIRLADRIYLESNGKAIPPGQWIKSHSLRAVHADWGKRFAAGFELGARGGSGVGEVRGDFAPALLLLTLLAEYHPLTLKGMYGQEGQQLLDGRCRHLDLSDVLTRDVVILVGLAKDPGPVKLCTRRGGRKYRPVTPSEAHTLYRVVIPVEG